MKAHTKKLLSAGSLGVLVSLLVLAGIAWACTALPSISLSPPGGSPGTKVSVSGNGFKAGVPVELRWGSPDGPLVGTADGPDFSVMIEPPADSLSGVYYVVALQTDAAGSVVGKAASVFQLDAGQGRAGGGQTTVSSDLWPAFSRPALSDAGMIDSVSDRSNVPAALGAAFVSFGVVAMGAGLVVAAAARRRTVSS